MVLSHLSYKCGLCDIRALFGNDKTEVMNKMSYVDPKIQTQFESLPVELKNAILERDVKLNSLADLILVLEDIVEEG